jgi:glycosyltransferase involved in cell wall biosynthesis
MAGHRVLYFITELNVGGAERSLARLLAGLDRGRFAPTVACLYGSDSPVADDIRALGIPVHDLYMAQRWRWDAFFRLYRLLRREQPAILHTLLFHANISGRIVGRLAGVPIVISGERTMGMESRWRYRLNRITQGLADRVVCVSPQVADFVIDQVGLLRAKVVVIPNGVDADTVHRATRHRNGVGRPDAVHRATRHRNGVGRPDAVHPLAPLDHPLDTRTLVHRTLVRSEARVALGLPIDEMIVGTVARLDPVKRLDVLLRALAALEDVQAVIVGYGPEERRLKAMAGQLGVLDRVLFAGHQRDVHPWLAAMDLFVLTSDWEGMSNALLEAMAARLPVVATATGGTPDVVLEDETGFLVPPGDPPALTRAIQALLADPALRDRLGQAGQRRVAECFSVEQMVERTQALYSNLFVERTASSADSKHRATRHENGVRHRNGVGRPDSKHPGERDS